MQDSGDRQRPIRPMEKNDVISHELYNNLAVITPLRLKITSFKEIVRRVEIWSLS